MADKPRLKEKYETELRPALIERFGYKNMHQAPTLVKVCVNMGVSDARSGPDAVAAMEHA